MTKKIILLTIVLFGFLLSAQPGYGQENREELMESFKISSALKWKDSHHEKSESQNVAFNECKLILTKKTTFKGGQESVDITEIPLARIDLQRIESHQHAIEDDIFYMGFYILGDEKEIKVTTFNKGKPDGEPFYTHFFSIYSRSEKEHRNLIEVFKKLVASCKDGS